MEFTNYLKKKTTRDKHYAESSINRYVSDILLLKNKNLDLEKGDPIEIVKKMENLYTKGTCKCKLTSIQVYMEYLDEIKKKEEYRKETYRIWGEIKKNKIIPKLSYGFGTLRNILSIRIKIVKNIIGVKSLSQIKYIQRTLLLGLYVLHAPRSLEYGDMEIVNRNYFISNNLDKTKKNYLIKNGSKKWAFQFGYYKTSSSYGIQYQPVSKKLKELIELCHAKMASYKSTVGELHPSHKFKYLLVDTKKGEMLKPKNYNGVSQMLRMISKEEKLEDILGVNMIRKLYITEIRKKNKIKYKLKLNNMMA